MLYGSHAEVCPYSEGDRYEDADAVARPFNGVDDALRVIHAVNPVEHAFSDVDHYRGENHACDHRHENHYEYGLADFVFLEIERSKEECQCPRDDVHDHSPKDLAA